MRNSGYQLRDEPYSAKYSTWRSNDYYRIGCQCTLDHREKIVSSLEELKQRGTSMFQLQKITKSSSKLSRFIKNFLFPVKNVCNIAHLFDHTDKLINDTLLRNIPLFVNVIATDSDSINCLFHIFKKYSVQKMYIRGIELSTNILELLKKESDVEIFAFDMNEILLAKSSLLVIINFIKLKNVMESESVSLPDLKTLVRAFGDVSLVNLSICQLKGLYTTPSLMKTNMIPFFSYNGFKQITNYTDVEASLKTHLLQDLVNVCFIEAEDLVAYTLICCFSYSLYIDFIVHFAAYLAIIYYLFYKRPLEMSILSNEMIEKEAFEAIKKFADMKIIKIVGDSVEFCCDTIEESFELYERADNFVKKFTSFILFNYVLIYMCSNYMELSDDLLYYRFSYEEAKTEFLEMCDLFKEFSLLLYPCDNMNELFFRYISQHESLKLLFLGGSEISEDSSSSNSSENLLPSIRSKKSSNDTYIHIKRKKLYIFNNYIRVLKPLIIFTLSCALLLANETRECTLEFLENSIFYNNGYTTSSAKYWLGLVIKFMEKDGVIYLENNCAKLDIPKKELLIYIDYLEKLLCFDFE